MTIDDVDRLLADVHAGDMTEAEALAALRASGLTADPDALTDALTALQDRDDLIWHVTDAATYLDCAPRYGLYDDAVQQAEDAYAREIKILARPVKVEAVA